MNWYKASFRTVKKSSSNIKIIQFVKNKLNGVADRICSIWDDFSKSNKPRIKINNIYFLDIYSGKQKNIEIILSQKDKRTAGEFANVYKNRITIYPEHFFRIFGENDITSEIIKSQIYYMLLHEVIHLVDPKSYMSNMNSAVDPRFFPSDYYNNPREFDAFSGQISQMIYDYLSKTKDKDETNKILSWLRSGKMFPMPKCIDMLYGTVVEQWSKHPELIKKFKQRIYNHIKGKI